MLIRPATVDDLGAITDLYNALLETTTYEWTETRHTIDERTAWFREQGLMRRPVYVAVDEGTGAVVGVATYGDFRDSQHWPGYRFTVEHTVHVAEPHWSGGVGRALLDALAAHARENGKRIMVAAIDGSNTRSIDFHGRLGFREVGRMPGIGDKWGQRLDLVLMQRALVPGETTASR